ncbi:MAG: hypothetical protein AB2792_21720 [Candidatus Thiodiazotropha sp.]
MAARHIGVWKLLKSKPAAECCECGKVLEDALEEEVWTIWNGKYIPDYP